MSDLTGRSLGKYQLQERLGRGGMAEVYRAYHPGLARQVAIKVLHPHLAEAPDFLGRFQREAQAMARLRHPHIVQVFDYDVEGEQHYIVMEYLPGCSLKQRLDDLFSRRERMPVDEILHLFRALLDAVGYAHAQGMIHRDLKPANVMIEVKDEGKRTKDESPPAFVPQPSPLRPVLTDFGIARIVGGASLTLSGMTVGTPHYMSPEQGQGETGDARSDLYSLGVVLYECLTGQVPFQGDTSVAVLLKHLHEPIPPLREARPDLPASIERVVNKALAKSPDDRYQTAAQFWADLAALLPASQASTAINIPAPSLSESDREKTAPSRTPAPASLTRPTAGRAPRPIRLGAAVVGVTLVVVAALLLAPRLLGPPPAQSALATAEAQLAGGNAQLAVDAFTSALSLDPNNAPALLGRARAYEALGQIPDALADVEQAIALAPDDPAGYQERARLSLQYGLEADPADVLADLDRAVQLAPDSARAHHLRGWAILNFPLVDETPNPLAALDDLRRAAELASADAEVQFTLARALLAAHQPFDALAAANRAVELRPDDFAGRKLRAHIRFALGDYHAAIDDLAAALDLEPDPTAQATLHAERGYLHLKLGAVADAQSDARRALELDPDSGIGRALQLLLAPALPRPAPDALTLARASVPDDPIWQALFDDLLSGR
jgi:serine/threonine protein kinase/Flp pilus assembly protein TadD